MILNDKDLKAAIKNDKIVTDMINENKQVQQSRIELTVAKVEDFYFSTGTLAFDNKNRVLPEVRVRKWEADGYMDLLPGAYLVTFNETVKIPKNYAALARPRSSLLRMGATMETAQWDAGYQGKSQCLLVVHNPSGMRLEKNARMIQLILFELSGEVEKGYSGIYQHEGVKGS